MISRIPLQIINISSIGVRAAVGIVIGFVAYTIFGGLFSIFAGKLWLMLTQQGDEPLPSVVQSLWDLIGIGLNIVFALFCILAVIAYTWVGIEEINKTKS